MRNSDMTNFEKEVRKALIDRDMTMGDLARYLCISQPYLVDLLKFRRTGFSGYFPKIISYLGLEGFDAEGNNIG